VLSAAVGRWPSNSRNQTSSSDGQLDGRVLAVVVEALHPPDVADLGLGDDHALQPRRRLDLARVDDRLDLGHPHQVAHRHDADQLAALDDGDVAVAVGAERSERLLDRQAGLDAVGVGGHPLGDLGPVARGAGRGQAHDVALGEDADGAGAVGHDDRADGAVPHEGGGRGHGLVG
jgi:hypothetical protein